MRAFIEKHRNILFLSGGIAALILVGAIVLFSDSGKSTDVAETDVAEQVETASAEQTAPRSVETPASATEPAEPFWLSSVEVTDRTPTTDSQPEPAPLPTVPALTPQTEIPVSQSPINPPTVPAASEAKQPEVAVKPAMKPFPEQTPTTEKPREAGPVFDEGFGVPLPKIEIVNIPATPKVGAAPEKKSTQKSPPPSTSESVASKPADKAKSAWVPFIYFYQKSNRFDIPDRIVYAFPSQEAKTPTNMSTDVPTDKNTDTVSGKSGEPMVAVPMVSIPIWAVQPVQPVCQPVLIRPISPVYPSYQYMPYQVAPSCFGAPKLVYPNGVVVKPKVYIQGQPVRNTLRAVTP